MKVKTFLFVLAAFCITVCGGIYALTPLDQTNQWGVGSTTLGIVLDSSGNFVPNVDSACSLGTSTYEWKNLRIDGTATIDSLVVDLTSTFAGDITASADLRTATFLGATRTNINIVDGTPIPVTGSFVNVLATGSYTFLPKTAQISVTTAQAGDYLLLTTTGTNAVTFTEGDHTCLRLGANTRALGQYDSLFLVFVTTGSGAGARYWQELWYIAN